MKVPLPPRQTIETSWRALTYFNAYRFLVSFLFVSLYWVGQLPQPLGIYAGTLFAITVHVYLAVALASVMLIHLRIPPYYVQVGTYIIVDITIVTLLMYASAGLSSGFGMLLVIVVAGGALLSPGKMGVLYAAIAAIAVLGHEVYVQLNHLYPRPNYTHAGFLGITFFVTAFIANVLAARVQESEELARQRAIDLQKLARLNEQIVQHMQSGIVVIDDVFRVTLINGAARRLLKSGENIHGKAIGDVSAELEKAIRDWLKGQADGTVVIPLAHAGVEAQASFTRLSSRSGFDILVFLDDVATLRQRAQQMKLASLGRLTASIAHEVRNPLGAISHAGQLLSESTSVSADDRRLTGIIEEQSRRVNSIIEDIMGISRRNRTELQPLDLCEWLENFRSELLVRHQLERRAVELDCEDVAIQVRMDPDQLHQILWNLCENGIRYSREMPLLRIRSGVDPESERPYIDVMDNGPGIAAGAREQLFEPFFTTENDGTGLGLYIARELCEANQATLQLQKSEPGHCCFRIVLAHPQKHHIVN